MVRLGTKRHDIVRVAQSQMALPVRSRRAARTPTMDAPNLRPDALSARTVDTARAVLAGRRVGFGGYLAFAGPAVIASIAYMDPGNFATNIQARRQIRLRACSGWCCSPI